MQEMIISYEKNIKKIKYWFSRYELYLFPLPSTQPWVPSPQNRCSCVNIKPRWLLSQSPLPLAGATPTMKIYIIILTAKSSCRWSLVRSQLHHSLKWSWWLVHHHHYCSSGERQVNCLKTRKAPAQLKLSCLISKLKDVKTSINVNAT